MTFDLVDKFDILEHFSSNFPSFKFIFPSLTFEKFVLTNTSREFKFLMYRLRIDVRNI